MSLQAQLAYLREQAAQRCISHENPNEKYFGKPAIPPQDLQSWIQMENSNMNSNQFLPNMFSITNLSTTQYYENTTTLMDINPINIGNYENSGTLEESMSSFSRFDERCNHSISYYDMESV